jgi:hypothetical protein
MIGFAFALVVLACPVNVPVAERDCVAVVAEVETVADCRALYREIQSTMPEGMRLTFPECVRKKK